MIESNKAWEIATTVRRDWLRAYLSRKAAAKGTATYLATSLAQDAATLTGIAGNHLAADLLGLNDHNPYGRRNALTTLPIRIPVSVRTSEP